MRWGRPNMCTGKEQQNGYEHYTTFLRRPAFRKPRKKEVVFSLYQGPLPAETRKKTRVAFPSAPLLQQFLKDSIHATRETTEDSLWQHHYILLF